MSVRPIMGVYFKEKQQQQTTTGDLVNSPPPQKKKKKSFVNWKNAVRPPKKTYSLGVMCEV